MHQSDAANRNYDIDQHRGLSHAGLVLDRFEYLEDAATGEACVIREHSERNNNQMYHETMFLMAEMLLYRVQNSMPMAMAYQDKRIDSSNRNLKESIQMEN